MDQQDSEHLKIAPEDRFRAGDHLKDLQHDNPPLAPPGVVPVKGTVTMED